MESGESIPAGEPAPYPADTPPGMSETQEAPDVWAALILPVIFIAATWAVDRFTRSMLGDWRYVPVVILGSLAIYFTVMAIIAVIVAAAVRDGGKSDGHKALRWLDRNSNVLLTVLFVIAVIVEIVRAYRDHSAVDAVSALVIVIGAGLIGLGSTRFATTPRIRRRVYEAARLLVPAWFLVATFFHLH